MVWFRSKYEGMGEHAAREAVANVLSAHRKISQRYDRIAEYLRPWTSAMALDHIGLDQRQADRSRLKDIARTAYTPFINLVIDTYGQSLKVDGLYTSDRENAAAWRWWQRNRMPAKQTGLHRDALTYGTAYATVLPANGGAGVRINCVSPRRMFCLYGDTYGVPGSDAVSDEFPMQAVEIGANHIRFYDESHVHMFGFEYEPPPGMWWSDKHYRSAWNLPYLGKQAHGLSVIPVVRYKDRWMTDAEEQFGIVEHLLGLQDRITLTNFEQAQTQYFTAFKQRYIIGWAPKDMDEALKQDVATTQFFDDPDVKTGQYAESDLGQYIESRQATVRDFAAVAQVPAQALGANAISNISADGLAALETSKDRKAAEIQTSLGESHEQLLRLCSAVVGDEAGASDFDAEIAWAETSARSFAQTVDGLGKLAAMLNIPPEELWQDIPGWSRERVERAKSARPTGGYPDVSDLLRGV